MKTSLTPIFVTLALTFHVHAYLSVPDDALNVRHFHMVERGETGEIVGRSFLNTFDQVVERNEHETLERRSCTTINACGTAGGCMVMAGQRYCTGVPWQKSFQEAVKQTGANGVTGLKLMAEGIGRGPVGMIAGAAKATAKAIMDAKKTGKKSGHNGGKKTTKKTTKKSSNKGSNKGATKSVKKSAKKNGKKAAKKSAKKGGKKKRELADENVIMNRRDFEIVERDEDFNLVERGEYSTFDLVIRNEDGSLKVRQCEMYNSDTSCQ